MPLDNFFSYSLLQIEPGFIKALLYINQEHDIFKGHFPGNPVTPGVTQVEMIRQVFSKSINRNLMLAEAKNLKYMSPILPPFTEGIELTIEYTEQPIGFSTNCVLSRKNQIFTKIRGTFCEQ